MASYALGIDVLVKGLGGLNQVNSALNRIDKNGATVASTFRLVRGAFIALGGAGVLKSMLDVATAADKTNRELTALYGGAQLGKQAFETARKFALDYKLSLDDVQKASVILARIFPLPQDLQKNLEQAGVASAAFGISVDKAAEMIAKANVEGIGTTSELAQYIKRFYPDIAKEAEKSGLRANEALSKLLGKNGPLGGALKDQADSIQGSLNQIQNAVIGFGENFLTSFTGSFTGGQVQLDKFNAGFRVLGVVIGEIIQAFINVGRIVTTYLGDWYDTITGFYGTLLGGLPSIERFKNAFDKINFTNTKKVFEEIDKGKGIVDKVTDAYTGAGKAAQEAKKASDAYGRSLQAQADQEAVPGYLIIKQLEEQRSLLYQLGRAGEDAFKQLEDAANPYQETVDLIKGTFGSLKTQGADALLSIFNGTKSATQAMYDLGQAIAKQLINGFLQLAIEVFILDYVKKKFREIRDEVFSVNSGLRQQIALQGTLAAMPKGGSYGGGGGGGNDWVSTAIQIAGFFLAGGGPAAANQPYIVGEKGPELFVPNSNGTVISNNDLASSMAGNDMNTSYGNAGLGAGDNLTVTFNINTIDARDFDQLLTTRQDLIIGLINRGLAERGKRSLTA
jgi:hypothetical protein